MESSCPIIDKAGFKRFKTRGVYIWNACWGKKVPNYEIAMNPTQFKTYPESSLPESNLIFSLIFGLPISLMLWAMIFYVIF